MNVYMQQQDIQKYTSTKCKQAIELLCIDSIILIIIKLVLFIFKR